MMFTYIFSKTYYFYVRVFREEDIPHWFASAVLTLLLVINIVVILDVVLFIIKPEIIKDINVYYKYFALITLFGTIFYMHRGGRYKKVLKSFDSLSRKRNRTLGIISVIYISLLIGGFICIGELVRDFNANLLG